MLFSEEQERGKRFKLSLKMGFPFLFIIFIFFILRFNSLSNEDIILLFVLSIIYTYYIFYLIYRGFKITLIDSITRSFNYSSIMKIMDELKEKNSKNYISIMVSISNIADINERYGLKYGDKVLKEFVKKLNIFLEDNKFKRTSIGRYRGGIFLFFLTCKEKEIRHLLKIFEKNIDIFDTEIKIDFSILPLEYDEKKENIILKLLEFLKEPLEATSLIKPDIFDEIVCSGIKKGNFNFRYQQSINSRDENEKIYEVLIKLNSKEYGALPYSQVKPVVHRNGFEVDFDKAIIKKLIVDIKKKENEKYLVQFSAVSLRNQKFIDFIKYILEKEKVNPKNIIIQMSEKKPYNELQRFKEILQEYKNLGFSLCLNHFGGDNATMQYLKHLPIEYVNFDIEYTKNIKDKKQSEILKYFIMLLNSLHVKSIIKFIDKKENYDLVKDMGIDFIQGHFISKPKKLEEL